MTIVYRFETDEDTGRKIMSILEREGMDVKFDRSGYNHILDKELREYRI